MFDRVWSGSTTRSRTPGGDQPRADDQHRQRPLHLGAVAVGARAAPWTDDPGSPASSVRRKTRRSWCGAGTRGSPRGGWTALARVHSAHAPVERAPRQPERLRGVAHVAVEAGESLLDQTASRRPRVAVRPSAERPSRSGPEPEIGGAHLLALREEDRPLDGVIELADVARPRMGQQRLHRAGVKPSSAFRYRATCRRRKCVASVGISSRRSRSGGKWISIVFSRKSRSSRNRPSATSCEIGIGRRNDPHIDLSCLR